MLALRVLAKLRLLPSVRLYPRVRVGDVDLAVPILNGTGYTNLFDHEPWLDSIIRRLLELRSGAFLDVGVNVGQTLLKFLQFSTEQHRYVGFEPNSSCLWYLNSLLANNELRSVEIVPTGLSDFNGVIRLFLKNDFDAAGSAVEGFRPAEEYVASRLIPVLKGDEVVGSLGLSDVAIVKIDVEGGELEVLRGLTNTLRTHHPFVISEILPVYDPDSEIGRFRRARIDELEGLMRSLGYSCMRMLHDGSMERLERIDSHSSLELCEYLFVHEADLDRIGELTAAG
jgi:FkbM family methyltransferase